MRLVQTNIPVFPATGSSRGRRNHKVEDKEARWYELSDFAQKLSDFAQAVMTDLREVDKPAAKVARGFTYVRIGRTRARAIEALRVMKP